MAKPILVIRLDRNIDRNVVTRIYNTLSDTISDWHIIPVVDIEESVIKFEAFHEGNATDIEIEELKKLVLKQIEECQPSP